MGRKKAHAQCVPMANTTSTAVHGGRQVAINSDRRLIAWPFLGAWPARLPWVSTAIPKVNSWSPMGMWSPSLIVARRGSADPTFTPLADRRSVIMKLVPVSTMTAW